MMTMVVVVVVACDHLLLHSSGGGAAAAAAGGGAGNGGGGRGHADSLLVGERAVACRSNLADSEKTVDEDEVGICMMTRSDYNPFHHTLAGPGPLCVAHDKGCRKPLVSSLGDAGILVCIPMILGMDEQAIHCKTAPWF